MAYEPEVPDPVWSEVRDFATSAVAQCSGLTAYSDRDLSIAATKLCVWAWETAGFDLDVTVVFRRDVIAHFVAVGAAEYKPAGRGNLRTQLLRMAEVLLPDHTQRRLPPLPPSDPTRPYKPNEVMSLRAWAETQTTPQRRANARVLLSLGLGAGLSAIEIGHVKIADIIVGEGVTIHVTGERQRDVVVLRGWESDLVERTKQLAPDRWAFREGHTAFYPNLVSNFVNRSQVAVVRPQAQRMRTTWIVRHLNAGIPVSALVDAAGVDGLGALSRYLRFLEPVGGDRAREFLRNA